MIVVVKSMNVLLVEQGFIFSQVDSNTLDFRNESELNVEFLKKFLTKVIGIMNGKEDFGQLGILL